MLEQRRNELIRLFSKPTIGQDLVTYWPAISKAIVRWFMAYKSWEKTDEFSVAFREGRMTMRHPKKNNIKHSNTDIFGYNRSTGAKVNSKFFHKVGLVGVREMQNPAYFDTWGGPVSRKAELGLYELSASLLDPKRLITKQTFAWLKDGDLFVFMPLSDQRDQTIYRILNNWRKRLGAKHVLSNVVRNVRARMTRIKLGADHDMGTGYTMLGDDSNPHKLKYGVGLGKKTKLPEFSDKKEKFELKNVTVTTSIIEQFRSNALKYKSMSKGRFKVNEIIVAYRHHASETFPMFVRYSAGNDRFDVVHLTKDDNLEDDPDGRYVTPDGLLVDG